MKVILQQETTECGHAALLMVLSHYGCYLDLESYSNIIPISPEGTSFLDLIRIADNFGLDATPYSVKQGDIQEIKLPAIMQIQGNHFVVVEKIDKKYIYIIDPAVGKRKLLRMKLFEYIGLDQLCYVLEFKAKSSFRKQNHVNKLVLIDFIKSTNGIYKFYIIFFLFTLFLQVIILLTPLYVQITMDKVVAYNNTELLTMMLIGFAIIYVFDIFISYFRESLVIYIEKNTIRDFSIDFFKKLIRLPEDFFQNKTAATKLNKFDAIEKILSSMIRHVSTAIIDIVMLVSLMVAMLLLNFKLTLIVLAIMSINLILYFFHHNKKTSLMSEYWYKKNNMISTLLENINNIKTLKIHTLEKYAELTYARKFSEYISTNKAIDKLDNMYVHYGKMLAHFDTLIVVYIGALFVIDDKLSLGMLYSFIFYKTLFASSFISLINNLVELKSNQSNIDQIKDVFFNDVEFESQKISDKPVYFCDSKALFPLDEVIKFKDFSFYYKNNLKVFENLNFQIDKNQSCCIVGKSGSGKTTILDCLTALKNVEKGNIYIGGIDITQIPIRYLRQNISYMTTEQHFFQETIVKNIAVGEQNIDISKVKAILEGLDLYEYIINELPGGLFGYVGDMNSRFSTGEKQRLLLARAIYKESKIMLLDEPTSALDSKTEKKVMDYLISLDRRMVIVTHRRSVAKYFENVVNLDDSQEREQVCIDI